MRPIPDCAVAFVKDHEGLRLTAYADVAGVVTVGWGHAGSSVKVGQAIPLSLAELYLKEDLELAARRLCRVLDEPVILKLTDHQWAALLSFVFNVGCGDWTIWRLLNKQQFDQIPAQLMRFVYAGGKQVPGLVNRRAAEVKLWATSDEPAPSSAVTRNAVATAPVQSAKVIPLTPAKPSLWARLSKVFA